MILWRGLLPGPVPRQAATAMVLVTVGLDVLALGLMLPILPKLVERMAGGNTAQAAVIFGVFSTAFALMQFLFQPLLGALSDRYGRRPVILLSNLGLGLDYVLMAVAPNLWWLFVGRVIAGITAASFSAATAYVADVTPPERRAAAFGLVGVAFGIGFVVGPAVGGLLGMIDDRLPFWVAAALSLANAAYGYFVLPESLAPENRARLSWRRASPLGALPLFRRNRVLLGLAGAMFLLQLSEAVWPTVFVLHAGYTFGWGEGMVGLSFAAFGALHALVLGTLVKPAVAAFGERGTILLGAALGVVGLVVIGLGTTSLAFWLSLAPMAMAGITAPAAQAIMTRHVDATEQGRLQGANSSIYAIATLIAPTLFTQSFALGIADGGAWPGIPYLIAAALLAGSGWLGWVATRGER